MIVQVEQGKLRGKESVSVLDGRTYYSFQGIPYAKPPLGDLRFRPPQPSEKWQEDVYDATYERSACYQQDVFILQEISGSEDCLYLNVYTPEAPSKTSIPKPVMVFIHGGGFFCGSSSDKLYSADFFVAQDVILVTFNYRLHALGYLNLGISSCPGNAGMKDQTLALRWVKDNIRDFGGDPTNVTIFGESAGGSSVSYHLISPLSKGLFQKAIQQSGNVYNPWAVTHNPKEIAFQIGEKLGHAGKDPETLAEFLKQQPVDKLLTSHWEVAGEKLINSPGIALATICSPSVEDIKEGAFLPDFPEKLFATAEPVPVISGVNSNEGIIIFDVSPMVVDIVKSDFSVILQHNFKFVNSTIPPDLVSKVKQFYFGSQEVAEETKQNLADFYTDIFFNRFYESIDFVEKSSAPVYVYEFDYRGQHNFYTKYAKRNKETVKGASHADELGYLFHHKLFPDTTYDEQDRNIIETLTGLWTKFAKTGKPTDQGDSVQWQPHKSSNPRYLYIGSELKSVDGYILNNRLDGFKKLLGTNIITYSNYKE